jgi:acyl-coenzyme A synthetase/AMP-(fatty) acid ligase
VAAADSDAPAAAVLVEWTNQRVGKQQRLAGAVYVAELPRNPNGKILKRELRQRYADWEKDSDHARD